MITAKQFREMESIEEVIQSIENALSVLEERISEERLIEEEKLAVIRNLAYISQKCSGIIKDLAKDMLDEIAPTL
jgi:hypothetical protein